MDSKNNLISDYEQEHKESRFIDKNGFISTNYRDKQKLNELLKFSSVALSRIDGGVLLFFNDLESYKLLDFYKPFLKYKELTDHDDDVSAFPKLNSFYKVIKIIKHHPEIFKKIVKMKKENTITEKIDKQLNEFI